ncbi:MAG: hypothetical protein Ct9H300mP7_1660 [Verrucomicrobiota bacterium]|nr:MAG: hypothetical protein Ct9H300mP7_1660 [Verrucomicrobiota bacterium]
MGIFRTRHMLECGSMENEINTGHSLLETGFPHDIADDVLELRERLLHLPLFLFVGAEDANSAGDCLSRCVATRFPKEPVPPVIRIVDPETFMPRPRQVWAPTPVVGNGQGLCCRATGTSLPL